MAEEFVEKILDKTRWEDGSFLDTLTDVIKVRTYMTYIIYTSINRFLRIIISSARRSQTAV